MKKRSVSIEKTRVFPWENGAAEYPVGIQEILKLLRFAPEDGRIWLDDQRMVMMHLTAMVTMRRQLVDTLGFAAARALLTRIGYSSGTADAAIALRMRPHDDSLYAFMTGPLLHGLEGMTRARPLVLEIDVARGKFEAEFRWDDCAEVDAHIAAYGLAADPVCWMQLGYASGYCSAFMGRRILFREVECSGMGAPYCRIIGKPTEEWVDSDGDGQEFDPMAGGPGASRPAVHLPDCAHSSREKGGLIGVSSGFVTVCTMLEKVAKTNAAVLFLGETGVGKGMFARALHKLSARSAQNFVAVNCAAIPETLVESELFGVQKGAFTGAVVSRAGRFEHADGGTLFLDEVGTLSLPAQAKFLRVLQDKEIERVGDMQPRKVDVRVIAATNEDLATAVGNGAFREDLYYRLNVFPIHIPPLRERRDDIPVLMAHFLKHFAALHTRRITGFTERAVDALLRYDYPGNIRELENMVERAVILADDDHPLDISHLFSHAPSFMSRFLRMKADGHIGGPIEEAPSRPIAQRILDEGVAFSDVETALVELAVSRSKGNLTEASRMLGISRAQVAYRMKQAEPND